MSRRGSDPLGGGGGAGVAAGSTPAPASPGMGRRSAPVLLLGAAAALALAVGGWVPAARATPLPSLALWGAGYAAFLGAAGLHRSRPVPRWMVWGVGVTMRATLLPLAPHYSDDIHRYLWDGWVQLHGMNPYLHAPADPGVAELAGAGGGAWFHSLINHPEIPTIYPPGAQVAFLCLSAVAASVPVFKTAWVVCDLGVAWLVDRAARRGGEPVARAAAGPADAGPRGRPVAGYAAGGGRSSLPLLLYLWCPLPVLEVAWSGHLEPLGILPLLGACLLLGERRTGARTGPAGTGRDRAAGDARSLPLRRAFAGTLVGAAAAVKLAPLATLPALLRRHGMLAAAAAVALPLLLYLPYAEAGPRLFEGLTVYARTWEFNAGPYRLLEALAGPGVAPRAAAGLGVAAVAVLAGLRRWSLPRTAFWVLGTGILLSPTVHPWYVLWVLPFAALFRSRGWILFAGLTPLAYWGHDAYRATGEWPLPGWLSLLIWGPLAALLIRDALAGCTWGRRRSRP